MIKVTRFDGSELTVNAALIEFVEATPDTVISMFSGRKIIVKEDVEKIIGETIEYLQRVGALCFAALPDESHKETGVNRSKEAQGG